MLYEVITGITGVAEIPAFAETVEVALRLHPQAAEESSVV